jgi:hypothetical protein
VNSIQKGKHLLLKTKAHWEIFSQIQDKKRYLNRDYTKGNGKGIKVYHPRMQSLEKTVFLEGTGGVPSCSAGHGAHSQEHEEKEAG